MATLRSAAPPAASNPPIRADSECRTRIRGTDGSAAVATPQMVIKTEAVDGAPGPTPSTPEQQQKQPQQQAPGPQKRGAPPPSTPDTPASSVTWSRCNRLSSVRINRTNAAAAQDVLATTVAAADFVAIDTEFSGVPPSSHSMRSDSQRFYSLLAKEFSKYSLLQLGVSTFHKQPDSESYVVKSFCIECVRSGEFSSVPDALAVVMRGGVDLLQVFESGIEYVPVSAAPAATDESKTKEPTSALPPLIKAIFAQRKPIIVHNGMLDLMILYQAAYGSFPENFRAFINQLLDHVPTVYDTKFLAHTVDVKATYLPFVYEYFRRSPTAPVLFHETTTIPVSTKPIIRFKGICSRYRDSGWCHLRSDCPYSHDVAAAVDALYPAKRRRVEMARSASVPTKPPTPTDDEMVQAAVMQEGAHSAAYDAFITGFSFLCLRKEMTESAFLSSANRVGFNVISNPILLVKSPFV